MERSVAQRPSVPAWRSDRSAPGVLAVEHSRRQKLRNEVITSIRDSWTALPLQGYDGITRAIRLDRLAYLGVRKGLPEVTAHEAIVSRVVSVRTVANQMPMAVGSVVSEFV